MKKKVIMKFVAGLLVTAMCVSAAPVYNWNFTTTVYADEAQSILTGWTDGIDGWVCENGSASVEDGKVTLRANSASGADVVFYKTINLENGKHYKGSVSLESASDNAWVNAYFDEKNNAYYEQAGTEKKVLDFETEGKGDEVKVGVSCWVPGGDTCVLSDFNLAETEKTAVSSNSIIIKAEKTKQIKVNEKINLSAEIRNENGETVGIPENAKLWWWVDNSFEGSLSKDDVWCYGEGVSDGASLSSQVEFNAKGYAYVVAELKSGDETLAKKTIKLDATDYVEDSIFVNKVENLSEDFIRGIDLSSYVSVTESGAKFRDFDGNIVDDAGFFKLLKESGTNWVRVRVWNDPYDESGNGYGGGNNDLEKAITIGKLATAAGMKVLVDFHYSDFWADPSRQLEPKAWKGKTVEEKTQLVYDYTKESLTKLKEAGVNVGMVQVGNETNNGIAGVSDWTDRCKLFAAGSKAIRDIDDKILVAVHFTDPQTPDNLTGFAGHLKENNVDYDVFASSYYPSSHGTMENLTKVLGDVAEQYGKKVMVAETSWAWSNEDGDGHGQSFNTGSYADYPISVQGQATELRDVIAAVNDVNKRVEDSAIGVFYWESTWIPAQYAYDYNGDLDKDILESNKAAWEKYGSGVATEAGLKYINEKDWDGGSVKDNEAFFDYEGYPLQSLTVYKDVYEGKKGTKNNLEVVKNAAVDLLLNGAQLANGKEMILKALPTTVVGIYSDSTRKDLPVVWDEKDIENIKDFGTFTIKGIVKYSDDMEKDAEKSTTCEITILPDSLLINGDFETEDNTGWVVSNPNNVDVKWNDTPFRGTGAMHFWSSNAIDFSISQVVTVKEAGKYVSSMLLQGGDGADTDNISINLTNLSKKTEKSASAKLKGWNVWDKALTDEVTAQAGEQLQVTISFKCKAGAWGSIDDVLLYKSGEISGNTGSTGNTSGSGSWKPGNNAGTNNDATDNNSGANNDVTDNNAGTNNDVTDNNAGTNNETTDSNAGTNNETSVGNTTPDNGDSNKPADNVVTNPDGSTTTTNQDGSTTTTATDGTVTVEKSTTAENGSVTTSTTVTKADGTKEETSKTVNTDGSSVEVKIETSSTGVVVKTSTTTKADGSSVKVTESKKTNAYGKEADVKVTTRTDKDGKGTSIVEQTTIPMADPDTAIVVTVQKDGDGNVTKASATLTAVVSGKKSTFSGDVIAQIKEAAAASQVVKAAKIASDDDIILSLTAKDNEGKVLYTVKTDTAALGTDEGLYLYKVDKAGSLIMANSKVYKVADDGSVSISITNKATYKLITKAEAKKLNNKIRATFQAKKSSMTLKKGENSKFAFKSGALTENAKKITYTSSKKSVAMVSSTGKITAKKSGKCTISAKITFKNGSTKTVKTIITVK